MKIIFHSNLDDPAEWIPHLESQMPELKVEVWPKISDPQAIEGALIWTQPEDGLARYPNLKAILSLGAGINQLDLTRLPPGVPLARLVDPILTSAMRDYCLFATLRYQRLLDQHALNQTQKRWIYKQPPDPDAWGVGVMGLGELGAATASCIAGFGFKVRGWSRTQKNIPGVQCFAGSDGLAEFASKSDILICLLPLTPDTRGILNAGLFRLLPTGAKIINAGRGSHLVEADLLAALETGQIGGATLDVFSQEPLPQDHPFWTHPKVMVTPHVASYCKPASAATQVVENLRRAKAGKPLLNQVDMARGY
jgi:glyoxylate/hydroxypyruvate reductase